MGAPSPRLSLDTAGGWYIDYSKGFPMQMTKEQIIQALAEHRPLAAPMARRKIWVRWAATGALIALLPLAALGIGLGGDNARYWPLAIAFAGLGVLGVIVAWLAASRKDATENQWGLAPLTPQECQDLQDLSSIDPQIQEVVDHWLDVWVSTGKSPRGRDLALLRKMVKAWKVASAPLPASSALSSLSKKEA